MRQFLNSLNLSKEEWLFSSHIEDCVRLSEKNNRVKFSGFLDLRLQKIAKVTAESFNNSFMLYGGFDDAERKMFGAFPDYVIDREEAFPISFIEFSYSRPLSHRDFLGSILSLGIKRELIGDILVGENKCYVIVQDSFAEHIVNSICKIGNVGVKARICSRNEAIFYESNFEENTVIISSLRLDCVISALCNKSRADASKFILSDKVMVNHESILSVSKTVCEGDVISVRSVGKFKIGEVISKTKKERLVLSYKKYI